MANLYSLLEDNMLYLLDLMFDDFSVNLAYKSDKVPDEQYIYWVYDVNTVGLNNVRHLEHVLSAKGCNYYIGCFTATKEGVVEHQLCLVPLADFVEFVAKKGFELKYSKDCSRICVVEQVNKGQVA